MEYLKGFTEIIAIGVIFLGSGLMGHGGCCQPPRQGSQGPDGVCSTCAGICCVAENCVCGGLPSDCVCPPSPTGCGCGVGTCICNLTTQCQCLVSQIAYGNWDTQTGCDLRPLATGDNVLFELQSVLPKGMSLQSDSAGGSEIVFTQIGVYELAVGVVTSDNDQEFNIVLGGVTVNGGLLIAHNNILAEKTILIEVVTLVPPFQTLTITYAGTGTSMCTGGYPGDQADIMLHLVDPLSEP